MVDEATRDLLDEGPFQTTALPPVPLKGFTEPVQAYRLEAEGSPDTSAAQIVESETTVV